MVWNGGDGEHALTLRSIEPGQHVFKVIVSDDGEAHVESVEPAQQGLFFGTSEGSDDAKTPKAKALKLKLGAQGGLQFEAPKHAGKKAPVQIREKAQHPMRVKGLKLSPKTQTSPGEEFEFQIESDDDGGHPGAPQVRVMRIPGGPGGLGGLGGPGGMIGRGGIQVQRARAPVGVGGIAVKPMRARVMPRFEVRTQQGECSGSCAAHCPARQIVVAAPGHGTGHGLAHAATKLQCSGTCTLVINGGQCELRCEGGECPMMAGAAKCEQCEGAECAEDDDDSDGATFELLGVGGNVELMQIGGGDDDDDSCCSSGEGDDDDSCCGDDDDDDDDGDEDEDEDEDEGDINYY
jgi:hypothetical protein